MNGATTTVVAPTVTVFSRPGGAGGLTDAEDAAMVNLMRQAKMAVAAAEASGLTLTGASVVTPDGTKSITSALTAAAEPTEADPHRDLKRLMAEAAEALLTLPADRAKLFEKVFAAIQTNLTTLYAQSQDAIKRSQGYAARNTVLRAEKDELAATIAALRAEIISLQATQELMAVIKPTGGKGSRKAAAAAPAVSAIAVSGGAGSADKEPGELLAARARINALETQVAELTNGETAREDRIAELEAASKAADDEKRSLAAANATIAALRAELDRKDSALARPTAENSDLKRKNTDLANKLAAAKAECERTRAELAIATSKAVGLEGKNTELLATISSLRTELAEAPWQALVKAQEALNQRLDESLSMQREAQARALTAEAKLAELTREAADNRVALEALLKATQEKLASVEAQVTASREMIGRVLNESGSTGATVATILRHFPVFTMSLGHPYPVTSAGAGAYATPAPGDTGGR